MPKNANSAVTVITLGAGKSAKAPMIAAMAAVPPRTNLLRELITREA